MELPRTLLARTGFTIAGAILVFLLFSASVVVYYIMIPMSERAAEDLAALVVFSAQTWVELPPDTREDFEQELLASHGLKLVSADPPLPESSDNTPYVLFFEHALAARLKEPVVARLNTQDPSWLWVDIPAGDRILRVGFPFRRIGPRPPLTVLLLILGGTVVTLSTTLLLVRRLNNPLSRLSDATRRFGRGEPTAPVPESGPEEVAMLTRHFNQMMEQIQRLLANRTTLLAGISHDLRTPIARSRLALEMIGEQSDPGLVAGIRRDLEEMDQLIRRNLELARGLDDAGRSRESRDIVELVTAVVSGFGDAGRIIDWRPGPPCRRQLNALAFRRVLSNLLDNAMRYAGENGVAVTCECLPDKVTVRVLDRGPGIPEDQLEVVFQPFHRLETSRSRVTGGSGLGLAIVRQICETHGWMVRLSPRPEGGMEARLELTVAEEASANGTGRGSQA